MMEAMSDYGPMEGWEVRRALDSMRSASPAELKKWVAARRRDGFYGDEAQRRQLELDEKEGAASGRCETVGGAQKERGAL